jgi:hypothetical protein
VDKLSFTRANLSGVKVIRVMMHVPMVELLRQTVIGQIPVYFPVVRCMWMPVVMSYLAKHLISLFLEDSAPEIFAQYCQNPGVASGGPWVHRARLHEGSIVVSQVVKSCLSMAIMS